ncbi:MAG: sortase [Bacilli bacterium]|nr:sortase [Bacilli bacterium]
MQKRKIINKILVVIGSLLIIVAIFSTYFFLHNKEIDKQETEIIINNLFSDVPISEIEVESEETLTPIEVSKQELTLNDDYLGYIELSGYGIKRLITTGTTKEILDKNLVGILSGSASLDDEYGNTILAGHSISNVFQKLHYMKVGEQIKIVTHKKEYYYTIVSKHTINNNDMSYFKSINDKRQLTLVTCKNNNKQRLIVIAELRG